MNKSFYYLKFSFLLVGALLLDMSAQAQNKVSGTVVDGESGESLPGVTVLIKGSSIGVITDLDGLYSIQAQPEDVLQFSFVGYTKLEETVGTKTRIDIKLSQDISVLNEVVVLGYSSKTQKELSASVVSLSAKELQNVTSPNIETMLQGKVAGLTVSSPSGQPGAAADIRIRGIASLDADLPPLMVVDGMIGGTFVPSDVENITVLKDAAAIGLYGSAGAPGVIIVTTKSGKTGAPQVTYSARMGVKNAVTGNFELMNGAELYEAQKQMWGENEVGFLKNRPEELQDRNYDWLDAGFRKAMIQTHNLSFRGRGDNTTYGLSLEYFNDQGTFINTKYERLNLRANLGVDLSDKFTIATDINVQANKSQFEHYSWFEDSFWSLPWDNPIAADGTLKGPDYITDPANTDKWYGQFKRNFLHSTKYNSLGNSSTNIIWSIRSSYSLTDWLSLETRTRLSSGNNREDIYYSPLTNEGKALNGEVSNRFNENYGVLSTHFLRFNKTLGKHDVSAFVAQEGGYSLSKSEYMDGIGLSSPTIKVIGGASNIQAYSGTQLVTTGISYISEVSYGYSSKYFATAYFRVDGSSLFAENNKYGYFPGGSLAWLISEEPFMKGLSTVNMTKLRASYGEVGNSNIPAYESIATYSLSGRYNGQSAGSPNNPANPNLSWETTTIANLGVDFGLFKNSIILNVDVYNKSVEGMLLDKQLAFSTGYETRRENIGNMRNRGVEFALSYRKAVGSFSYTGNFNISFNKNEVTYITETSDSQQREASGIRQIHKVGLEAFSWYMPVWKGIDPATGSPQWEKIDRDANGTETGRSLTTDYNVASAVDNLRPSQSALPTYTGGLNNSFSYKGLALSFLFTFQGGNHIYNYTREFVDSDGANIGINLMKLQDGWSRWEKPGDDATHPALNLGGSNNAHRTSTRFLEKGDYVRLRNVTLSYTVPSQVTNWMHIQQATFSVAADNLYTFTKFSGMDPDIGLTAGDFTLPGLSYLKYPISRQLLFGLNVNF